MTLLIIAGCLTSIGKVWGFLGIYHSSYLRQNNSAITSSIVHSLLVIMLTSELVGMYAFTYVRDFLGYKKGIIISLTCMATGFGIYMYFET